MSALFVCADRPAPVTPEVADHLRRWVDARQGRWAHHDWLGLLEDLRRSCPWPPDEGAVGQALEQARQEWHNLRRWERSREARDWVESHQGRWGPQDRPALREALRRAGYWPIDLAAAEEVLRLRAVEWWNLRYWQESGQPRWWVEARQGRWGHADWLALLESLRLSSYWPVNPEAVGAVLEEERRRYENLRRWQAAGHARAWVEARRGRWTHEEWLALLADLRRSEFWPVHDFLVELALERARAAYWHARLRPRGQRAEDREQTSVGGERPAGLEGREDRPAPSGSPSVLCPLDEVLG